MNADNGAPWDNPSSGGHSLSELAVWLIRQGVRVSFSAPYHPQTNGKLERFHRTLDIEVLAGRHFADHAAVQRAFDAWRPSYNCERPHEALKLQTPYLLAFIPTVNAMPMRRDNFIWLLHKRHACATCCVNLRYTCIDTHALFILRNRSNARDELQFFSGLPACDRITCRLSQDRLGHFHLRLGAFVFNRTFTVLSRYRFRSRTSLVLNLFESFLLLDDNSRTMRITRRV